MPLKNYFSKSSSNVEPISSANTITAASSRLDINSEESPTRTARNSNVDLSRTVPMGQYSTTSSTISPMPPKQPSHLNQVIDLKRADIIVLMTCFVTGLTDSAMFANYSIFTSMQSGNTIFMGLGASGQNTHPFVAIRCLFSLLTYVVGIYLFASMHNLFLAPKTRRLTVLISYFIQGALTFIAAGIIQGELVSRYAPSQNATSPREQWDSLAPICLLSLSAAGQIMAARSLAVGHVPTIVVTTMLAELFSDPLLWARLNIGRNQRAAAFVLMLLGAITGGWIDKASRTAQAALWMAGGLKFAAVVAVFFWPAERIVRQRDIEGQQQDKEIAAAAASDAVPEKQTA